MSTHYKINIKGEYYVLTSRAVHLRQYTIETIEDYVFIPFCIDTTVKVTGAFGQLHMSGYTNIYCLYSNIYDIDVYDLDGRYYFLFLKKDFYINNIHPDTLGQIAFDKPVISNAVQIAQNHIKLIEDILSNEYPESVKPIFCKSKIFELLLSVLHPVNDMQSAALKNIEVERMRKIKEIMDHQYAENLTISILAREVGTNEQYVKKHFKQLYGNTIHNYLFSRRMEKAKELLMSKNYKIADIAELIGYKHATHFTTAFKKYFGYKPNVLK